MTIWDEVRAERDRAHAKHGEKSMEAAPWTSERRLRILLEELGEVAREFNDADLDNREPDAAIVRAELIQVAAMAGAWADVVPEGEDDVDLGHASSAHVSGCCRQCGLAWPCPDAPATQEGHRA